MGASSLFRASALAATFRDGSARTGSTVKCTESNTGQNLGGALPYAPINQWPIVRKLARVR
jgi:hypothetical protein